MNTEIIIINIGDLLRLKISASKKALDDVFKRFPCVSELEGTYDFALSYSNFREVKEIQSGIVMKPFRNATYIVHGQDDNNIIAYSSRQQYSCENTIFRNNKIINIYCKDDNNSKVLVRVITELLIRKLLEKEFFPLHSSCIMKENKAVLFLGEKNSGKSISLFCNVLFDNAYPISNDITFVGKKNGEWYAFGLPYDITFDTSLLSQIGEENKILNAICKDDSYGSNKIRYSVADFINIFNTKWIWYAPISEVNVVNLNREEQFNKISKISIRDAIINLEKYGKDQNFSFDDYLKINGLYPSYNYEEMAKEIQFNKLHGNILKHYLRR